MKFKLNEALNEEYFFPDLRSGHYQKHVISDEDGYWKMPYMTEEEYDNLANQLSSKPADDIDDVKSTFVGYVTVSGRIVKYDKSTQTCVIYLKDADSNIGTLSLYRTPFIKLLKKAQGDNPKYRIDMKVRMKDIENTEDVM